MSPAAHIPALITLLTTDATFVADLQAIKLGSRGQAATPKALKGNRQFDAIGQENYPCWMIDVGDGRGAGFGNESADPAGLSIGSGQQDWQGDIELALVWHQQDYETAVEQHAPVHEALVRLLLRNPDLDGNAEAAYVVETFSDRSYRHPTHVLEFRLRVHSTIYAEGAP